MQAPRPFADLAAGTTLLAGQWLIRREIDRGGMGAVYEVEQVPLGRTRALKVMLPEMAASPKQRERFLLEARLGARIPSDHVVEVIDAGVDEVTGFPWIAMEFLEGENLNVVVKRRGRLSREEVREVFDALGHCLGAAHRERIVHCDLKPQNIFLARTLRADRERVVKLLDFGIARIVQEHRTAYINTALAGSPRWIAPEQTQRGGRIKPATDVWAMGLLAWHFFTGRYYWLGANQPGATVLSQLLEINTAPLVPASQRAEELGAPGSLPTGFDTWFARCVDRDVDARFQDAAEAVAELREVLGGAADAAQAHEDDTTTPRNSDVIEACVSRAWAHANQGRRDLAREELDRALAVNPRAADAWFARGVLRAREMDFEGARADIEKALQIDPAANGYHQERARILHQLGRYDEALTERAWLLQQEPDRIEHRVACAAIHAARREWALAEDTLSRCVVLRPEQADLWWQRAIIRAEQRRWREAVEDLVRATDLDPAEGRYLYDLARVWRSLGDHARAQADLERAAVLGCALAVQELSTLAACATVTERDAPV